MPARPAIRLPPGWELAGISKDGYEVRLDPAGGRGGSGCLLLRGAPGAAGFVGAMQAVEAAGYRGQRLRLAAWVRVEDVTGKAGLFLRVRDRDGQNLAFDNMDARPIRGSRGWALYEVVLDVPEDAAEVAFGAFLPGHGTLWADDFTLAPVGAQVPTTVEGSGAPSEPSPRPTEEGSAGRKAGSFWLLGGTTPEEYRVDLEPTGGRHGTAAASIRSISSRPSGFVTVMRWVDAREYRGERLRLSAWVKAESITGRAGLWMRVDDRGSRRALAFDNMEPRPIRGTAGWRRYDVVLDVSALAERIYYGALLDGSGRIRVDDFALEPVGPEVPVTDLLAPAAGGPANLDFDHPPTSPPALSSETGGRR